MLETNYPLALFVRFYGTDSQGKSKTDILTLEYLANQANIDLATLDTTNKEELLERLVKRHYIWNQRANIGIYQYAEIHWLEKITFSEEFKDSIWK